MGDVPARGLIRELDPDEHIVVVCHHGSALVERWPTGFGSRDSRQAQSMRGGIDQWVANVLDAKGAGVLIMKKNN